MPTDDPIADFDTHVGAIAVLGDPLRRSLYQFVIAQTGPVNRDEVATGTGVARHVAKFHLDKLVDEGLLAVEYARPLGRSGPGAGRPAKRYFRSSRELAVSLPQRDYELVGRLMAGAITTSEREGITVGEALAEVARATGRRLGEEMRAHARERTIDDVIDEVMSALARAGYEPRRADATVTLDNCPFHGLARDFTELVCAMNLDLLTGLVEGFGESHLEACLEPAPGVCCVRLRATAGT